MTFYKDTNLPEKYGVKQDLCLYLHDICLSVLYECMYNDKFVNYQIKEDENSLEGIDEAEDVIEWLQNNGYKEEANLILKRRIFTALLSDFLGYVLESLKASEKGKTEISYTLLRKPFKDNLFYLEWLISDGDGLLSMVKASEIEKYEVGKMRKNRNKQMRYILREAMNKNPFKELLSMLEKEFMYRLRYDYKAPFGLELMWNKANHLVTTASTIRSKDFNGLFLNSSDYVSRWDYYYTKIPMLLLYSTGIVIRLYEDLFEKVPNSTMIYNRIFINTKWFSGLNAENGKEFLESIIQEDEIPLYCENCEELTFIGGERVEDIQFEWGIDCDHCHEYISIAKFHFIDFS